jgi:hypothetical protein
VTVGAVEFDHKAYYLGAHQLRITGDRQTGRLLGAQLLGHHRAEVAKRIDIPATALFHHMTVEGLSDLDLSYPAVREPLGRGPAGPQTWTSQTQSSQPTRAASPDPPISPPAPERRVLLVCPHNAGRSIAAAALLNGHQPRGAGVIRPAPTPPTPSTQPWSPPSPNAASLWPASVPNQPPPSC